MGRLRWKPGDQQTVSLATPRNLPRRQVVRTNQIRMSHSHSRNHHQLNQRIHRPDNKQVVLEGLLKHSSHRERQLLQIQEVDKDRRNRAIPQNQLRPINRLGKAQLREILGQTLAPDNSPSKLVIHRSQPTRDNRLRTTLTLQTLDQTLDQTRAQTQIQALDSSHSKQVILQSQRTRDNRLGTTRILRTLAQTRAQTRAQTQIQALDSSHSKQASSKNRQGQEYLLPKQMVLGQINLPLQDQGENHQARLVTQAQEIESCLLEHHLLMEVPLDCRLLL